MLFRKQVLDGIAAELAEQYPESNAGWGVTLVPARDQLVRDVRPVLLVVLGAVGFSPEDLEIELKRLDFIAASMEAQLAAQQSEVQRLISLSQLQEEYVQSLQVKAGAPGVLRELPLQEGEWVNPGSRLAVVVQPGRLKAELRIPETQARDVVIGQRATIDTRNGIIPGRVVRIDPAVLNGTVTVDVALEGELPRGARPDLSVDGTIEIERLEKTRTPSRTLTIRSPLNGTVLERNVATLTGTLRQFVDADIYVDHDIFSADDAMLTVWRSAPVLVARHAAARNGVSPQPGQLPAGVPLPTGARRRPDRPHQDQGPQPQHSVATRRCPTPRHPGQRRPSARGVGRPDDFPRSAAQATTHTSGDRHP